MRFQQAALFLSTLITMTVPTVPLRAANALEEALSSSVVVYSADRDELFLGSGFLWGEGDLVLTNAHVTGGRDEVSVLLQDGREIVASVTFEDATRDVALVDLGQDVGDAMIPAPEGAAVGTRVYALGAPLEEPFTLTEGVISGLARQVDPAVPVLMIQHDAAVNPGSSGGALVDEQGRLIGMNSRIADGSRLFAGIAYAISAEDLVRIVAAMEDGTWREVPELGLEVRAMTAQIQAALNLPAEQGILIDAVAPGSRAEMAGLLAGDVLLAVDDQILGVPGDLALTLESQTDGLADLVLLREGDEITLELDLEMVLRTLGEPTKARPLAQQDYTLATLGLGFDESSRITEVSPSGPAFGSGLTAGDEILSVNGEVIAPEDLSAYKVAGPVLLLVSRQGHTSHIVLDPYSGATRQRVIGGANVLDPAVVLF